MASPSTKTETAAAQRAAVGWKRTAVACLLLGLATAAVYWPVARNGFINFDDPDYVTGNVRVQAGLTWESIRWAFTSYHSSNWHPLTWISHMLDCQLFGVKAAYHHLVNVAFHMANTLLLLGLLKRLTGSFWRSAIVAALFALHPLHVESVAWVAERKDVLSTMFFVLTLWAWAEYAKPKVRRPKQSEVRTSEAGSRPSTFDFRPAVSYSAALVLFALGLMSKPMLVTLPCVLLLLDFWPLRRIALAPGSGMRLQGSKVSLLLVEKVPFFALFIGSCVVTFLVQRASGAVVSLGHASFEPRLTNGLVSYGRYLAKTFWPADLAVFYPYRPFAWSSGEVIGSVLVLVVITALVLRLATRHPYAPVGWFWFLGTLVPVIGLVQVGKQALADRYTYLPHIGLFIAVVWTVGDLISAWQLRRAGTATPKTAPAGASSAVPVRFAAPISLAVALVLGVLAVLTFRQAGLWRNNFTLFQHAAAVTQSNFVAEAVIANALVEQNQLEEAIAHCRASLQIAPEYPEAYNTLGNIYAKQEKFEDSLANYRAAVKCDPTYGDAFNGLAAVLNHLKRSAEAEAPSRAAVRFSPNLPAASFNLAMSLHNQGKLDEAALYYQRVIDLAPKLAIPRRYLGNVLLAQGKANEAITQYTAALALRPEDADTHASLGLACLERGRLEEAAAQFLEVTRLEPTNAPAWYQLALIRQGQQQPREAIASYRKALNQQPDWPEALNNLAWLLAATPDPALRDGPEAVKLAARACTLTKQKEPIFIGTLAAAYAEAGRFEEAVKSAEKARELALAANQKETAERNLELIGFYRAGKAYHEGDKQP